MSFLTELKQRKVFRVGAAYLVVAWLAVQIASIVLPSFNAPAWAMRATILLFALGFPVALVSSWAWTGSPRGSPRAAEAGGSIHAGVAMRRLYACGDRRRCNDNRPSTTASAA